MLVGFQDDPSLRWRDDRQNVFDVAEKANAGIVRTTVYWSRIAEKRPANAANPFDPAYRFDDLDEFVRNAGMHGMEVMLTIWGTPAWANGGKGQNYAPTRIDRPPELREGARIAVLGPVQRLPVRAVLHGLERVEPRPVPLAAVRLEGQAGRAGDLREALPRGVRRDQGGQLARARRHRRDLRREAGTATSARRAPRRPSRRASSPSSLSQAAADAPLRRLVAPPVLDDAELAPDAEGALAERQPQPAAQVRAVAGALVPQGRADLDHGVRLRDEAGRAQGRQHRRSRPPTCARRWASPPTTRA